MNLVIDIGNTKTKIGVFNKELVKDFSIESISEEILASVFVEFPGINNCILCSVKNIDNQLNDYIYKKCLSFVILDEKTRLPFENKYKTPSTLGKDRLAGIAGAHNLYPGNNVLVIDAGTAVTYDIIEKSGNYLGGSISPGIKIRFKALNEYTSKLPLISIDAAAEEFGRDTKSSINAGVQYGLLFEIDGFIDSFSKQFDDLKVVLTGGDANFFVNKLKNAIFVIPNLTLTGLNYILTYNKNV